MRQVAKPLGVIDPLTVGGEARALAKCLLTDRRYRVRDGDRGDRPIPIIVKIIEIVKCLFSNFCHALAEVYSGEIFARVECVFPHGLHRVRDGDAR